MKRILSLIAAAVIGGLLVLGGNYYLNPVANQISSNGHFTKEVNNVNVSAANGVAPLDFTDAAEKAMPAVVHISAEGAASKRQSSGDPFFDFFGNFRNQGPQRGTGSGVIYTSDGYIITNNHVVDFAEKVEVTLNDNRQFMAEVVGTYPKADIAVLKVDGTNLPTMRNADSDMAKVGQWVLAVGNPFNLNSTVTAGIVSALGRDINIIQSQQRDAIESFIQTDAAVNPGNSGGALVDAQGRLLGINTAISTRTGSFEGYSFAIPINLAKRIADDIIENGSYQRPYLGVSIVELDDEYAQELGVNVSQGVVIEDLVDGGSAQFAGMLPKDVIVAVDGKKIRSVPELQEAIGRSNVGDTLDMQVIRRGKRQDIPVRLKAG